MTSFLYSIVLPGGAQEGDTEIGAGRCEILGTCGWCGGGGKTRCVVDGGCVF
jgi:hypothetical protein